MSVLDIGVKGKFAVLVLVVLAAFGAFGLIANSTIDRVKVGGPEYVQIIKGKDLIADILPPPEYIIESYLTAIQLGHTTEAKERELLQQKLAQLEKDFEDRHAYWDEHLPQGELKYQLLSGCGDPARQFFKLARERLLPLVAGGKRDEAISLIGSEMGAAYEQHRSAVNSLVEQANVFAAAAESHAATELSSGWTRMAATAAAAVLLLIGVCGLIAWSIRGPLHQLEVRLKDIAQGEGDLTKRVNITSKDEVGRVAGWFNAFLDKMQSVIGEVSSATTQVAAAATEIAASADEMAAAVGEVAQQTTSAAQRSEASGRLAGEGGAIVESTVASMKEIEAAVRESAASVTSLGERGAEIGLIISVINDIADQTNLLALNAAIEAARAGEHGRGFAVVADEVRKLADRTTKATDEIGGSIKAIQQETSSAAERMHRGSDQVRAGVENAQKAGDSLQKIVAGAGDLASMITSISAASEQAGAGANQSASAASELSGKAEQLRSLVERFKI